MPKFRKRPVEIEALWFTGSSRSADEIEAWSGGKAAARGIPVVLEIATLEGTMRADAGDWIIKGVNGEFYPCKPDIFAKTYEAI